METVAVASAPVVHQTGSSTGVGMNMIGRWSRVLAGSSISQRYLQVLLSRYALPASDKGLQSTSPSHRLFPLELPCLEPEKQRETLRMTSDDPTAAARAGDPPCEGEREVPGRTRGSSAIATKALQAKACIILHVVI